jgi:hypothetical protein
MLSVKDELQREEGSGLAMLEDILAGGGRHDAHRHPPVVNGVDGQISLGFRRMHVPEACGCCRAIAVDADGRLLMVNLTTADIADSTGAQAILDGIRKRCRGGSALFLKNLYKTLSISVLTVLNSEFCTMAGEKECGGWSGSEVLQYDAAGMRQVGIRQSLARFYLFCRGPSPRSPTWPDPSC